ncbi:baculoviral IAP repeat-containing protein 8-like [Procambarus clarkii]|uniref:baculoviral IAP repeat-containing protein 8-like n=1 Tax=Procambarus clarkii TaxID=6728 RepID=UPI00374305BB
MAEYKSCLASFGIIWPDMCGQSPAELSRAGFFSCGVGDHIRCFYCGGGLVNFIPSDDPWTLHARYYPNCIYLNLKKDRAFIKNAVRFSPPRLTKPIGKTLINALLQGLDYFNGLAATVRFPYIALRGALREYLKIKNDILPLLGESNCEEVLLWFLDRVDESEDTDAVTESPLEILSSQGVIFPSPVPPVVEVDERVDVVVAEENAMPGVARFYCKVCFTQEINTVLIPCWHMVICLDSVTRCDKCPVCRGDVVHLLLPIIS